jgi:ABC-2 type transport system ATP-binding protein
VSNSQPIIEVRDIKRSFRSTHKEEGWKGAFSLLVKPTYKTHEALKGVSFQLEPGSFNGLIGANGAGKTTLLKILSGLIPPSSGTARVLGFEPFRRELQFRKQIALVMGQKAQLWWDLPGLDAFDLLRAIYEIPEKVYRERLENLAELLDVKKHLHTQIRRLSLGERMKMELIGAIIHWPSVIFLDEPTIGLDILAAHKLREFLRVFNQREKATIILTSHNMEDIERLCSRVLILRDGELIFDGKPEGLTGQGERELRVRFLKAPAVADLAQLTGLPAQAIKPGSSKSPDEEGDEADVDAPPAFHFSVKKDQIVSVLQRLMQKHEIVDMGIQETSLETVIQRLYAEDRLS